MKNILFILSLILTTISFSQTLGQPTPIQDDRMKLAGQEMINFHNEYSKAVSFTRLSIGVSTLGVGISYMAIAPWGVVNRVQYNVGIGIVVVGSVMTLVGITKIVRSKEHLKNVGIILTGNSVGIKVNL